MNEIDTDTWLWGNILFAIFGLGIICLILCAFSKPFNLNMFYFFVASTVISLLLLVWVLKNDVNFMQRVDES